jgi:polysaccharide export outer membrane protein
MPDFQSIDGPPLTSSAPASPETAEKAAPTEMKQAAVAEEVKEDKTLAPRTEATEAGPVAGPVGPTIVGPGPGAPCNGGPSGDRGLPTELAPVSHPPYMIEPPDILLINAIRMIPRGPYTAQPLDVLLIRVVGTVVDQPIKGAYTVSSDGTISLGFSYGTVRVAGLTLEAIQAAIRDQARRGRPTLNPQVAVAVGQYRTLQQVGGEHLVRQDGTIGLGTYGCVYVTGLTIPQAKLAIERHLSQLLVDPEISLDVFAYNCKVYYIFLDGGGYGQQVFRFPIVGKETVRDAINHIQGLPTVASKRHIWVARPAPTEHSCVQILPVDWRSITEGGTTTTNWQILPGDRIYVKADPLIAFDDMVAKVLAPIQRIMAVVFPGAETLEAFHNNGNNNGNIPIIAP